MTARNFFRRVNRGLVLAGVLLVGLTGYLVADAVRFTDEKTAIEEMLRAYALEAEQFMILPEITPGEPPPDGAVEAKTKENEAVLKRYLTGSAVNTWGSAHDTVKNSLQSALEINRIQCAYVTECEFTVARVANLRKNGPSLAVGELTIRAAVKSAGPAQFLLLFWQEDITARYYSNGRGSFITEVPTSAEGVVDTEPYTLNLEITFGNLEFRKVDGVWKIADIGWSRRGN